MIADVGLIFTTSDTNSVEFNVCAPEPLLLDITGHCGCGEATHFILDTTDSVEHQRATFNALYTCKLCKRLATLKFTAGMSVTTNPPEATVDTGCATSTIKLGSVEARNMTIDAISVRSFGVETEEGVEEIEAGDVDDGIVYMAVGDGVLELTDVKLTLDE